MKRWRRRIPRALRAAIIASGDETIRDQQLRQQVGSLRPAFLALRALFVRGRTPLLKRIRNFLFES